MLVLHQQRYFVMELVLPSRAFHFYRVLLDTYIDRRAGPRILVALNNPGGG
uniref:Uncharacterized protein n=1 Tax=Anguilla anguilla TaxID=7936 RepID=A0A0E9R649_ANGAN